MKKIKVICWNGAIGHWEHEGVPGKQTWITSKNPPKMYEGVFNVPDNEYAQIMLMTDKEKSEVAFKKARRTLFNNGSYYISYLKDGKIFDNATHSWVPGRKIDLCWGTIIPM